MVLGFIYFPIIERINLLLGIPILLSCFIRPRFVSTTVISKSAKVFAKLAEGPKIWWGHYIVKDCLFLLSCFYLYQQNLHPVTGSLGLSCFPGNGHFRTRFMLCAFVYILLCRELTTIMMIITYFVVPKKIKLYQ